MGVYGSNLLDQIAAENAVAEQRVQSIVKPAEARFKDKLDALWGKGVPHQLYNIVVELKFSMRSWAYLETNGIHDIIDKTDPESAYQRVVLFAMASTLHDDRVDWPNLFRNGYRIDEKFQEDCMKAWELSQPLAPTCPPDDISSRVMSNKPKPPGFGIDYMGMLVSLGEMFGWSKEEFWEMSPREIGLILDERNWNTHFQNEIEKEHVKKSSRGR